MDTISGDDGDEPMGMIRKFTSLSTLGVVDFKSDKERIANSTRKGMKAQKAMLVEMKKANKAKGIAPTNLSHVGFVANAQGAAAVRAVVPQPPAPTRLVTSPDGRMFWDGAAWHPMPANFRWDGFGWVRNA